MIQASPYLMPKYLQTVSDHLQSYKKLTSTVHTIPNAQYSDKTPKRYLQQTMHTDSLKPGLITPAHKKRKPLHDPDGHRRIIVTPIVGRVIEKVQLAQTKVSLKSGHGHSKLQYYFIDHCSSTACSFILTGAVAEAMGHE